MDNTKPAEKVRQLQLPAIAEEMSQGQINEIMDLETKLTMFQVKFMMEAVTKPGLRLPLWGHQKREDWAKIQAAPLYYAPALLEEEELRQFLQLKVLERMKLIRHQQLTLKNECWQLTARGRLVVIWHMRVAADYQAQMNHGSTTDSA